MLEVKYNTLTKEVTGWCGDERQFGNLEREGHKVVILDIPIPDKSRESWLCDGMNLILNPDYIEPEPPRNLSAEIDEIKAKITALEIR